MGPSESSPTTTPTPAPTAQKAPLYIFNESDDRVAVLQLLLRKRLYQKTTFDDQLLLSQAPFNVKMALKEVIETAEGFFECIAHCKSTTIFDHGFLHRRQIERGPRISGTLEETVETLQMLEDNHRQILLFLWLSQRWPTLFVDRESANDMKLVIEKRIAQELLNLRHVGRSHDRWKR